LLALLAAGVRVLVDPWLVGDLTFAEQDWLYKGKKRALRTADVDLKAICSDTDVILLTQVGGGAVSCRGWRRPSPAAAARAPAASLSRSQPLAPGCAHPQSCRLVSRRWPPAPAGEGPPA
jgi:hypothetical protein